VERRCVSASSRGRALRGAEDVAGGRCSGEPPWPGLGAGSRSGPEGLPAPCRAARLSPSSGGRRPPWEGAGASAGCGASWGPCPGPGGKRVQRHQGAGGSSVPSHSPAGAAPCCLVCPGCGCADSSPRCVPRGMGTSQPFPGSPPSTWPEQGADGSAGGSHWAGDTLLGRQVLVQGCVCGSGG